MDAALAEPRHGLDLRGRRHLAPAKVNLALHVTGRRPDGYHTLSSLVAFAAVGDRLTVAPASVDIVETVGPFGPALEAALPPGGRNIVAAARDRARSLALLHGSAIGPLRITLEKNLPVASGIGGGSADAAALLRLCLRAAPQLEAGLREVALELGADVPMCVEGATARVSGIGEAIRPVPGFPAVAAVLVNPNVPVATPLVFRALERRDNPPMPEIPPVGDVHALAAFLRQTRNDLEPPAIALAPAIADALAAAASAGAIFARMSGSGATVFGLFPDADEAATAADRIRDRHPGWWVEPTMLGSARASAA